MKRLKRFSFCLTVTLIFSLVAGFHNGNKNLNTGNIIDIVPCKLLTQKQVEKVLPGTDEGFTAASGGSLMKGVDSYQCSYSNEKYELFTVIVNVAKTKDDFDWVKPKKSIPEIHEGAVKLTIGDGGWLYGDPDDMKVSVSKGFSVVDLELMSENAKDKSDALVELATIILNKIN